jgi:hypothetical protein
VHANAVSLTGADEPMPRGLAAVRAYMSELSVEPREGGGTVVTARQWLD